MRRGGLGGVILGFGVGQFGIAKWCVGFWGSEVYDRACGVKLRGLEGCLGLGRARAGSVWGLGVKGFGLRRGVLGDVVVGFGWDRFGLWLGVLGIWAHWVVLGHRGLGLGIVGLVWWLGGVGWDGFGPWWDGFGLWCDGFWVEVWGTTLKPHRTARDDNVPTTNHTARQQTPRHEKTRDDTVRHGTAQYRMTANGMAPQQMAWHGKRHDTTRHE